MKQEKWSNRWYSLIKILNRLYIRLRFAAELLFSSIPQPQVRRSWHPPRLSDSWRYRDAMRLATRIVHTPSPPSTHAALKRMRISARREREGREAFLSQNSVRKDEGRDGGGGESGRDERSGESLLGVGEKHRSNGLGSLVGPRRRHTPSVERASTRAP